MMKKMVRKVIFWSLTALLGAAVTVNAAPAKRNVAKLSARGRSGTIAVQSDRADLPFDAKLTLSRQTDAATRDRIRTALKAKKGPKAAAAKADPAILAMYDISVDEGATAWQPTAGSPARVTVTLDEPIFAGTDLGLVHLTDDGTVETLDPARYGFERDPATKVVTGFWFKATGFSIYAIVDGNPPRRTYSFFSLDANNQYVPYIVTTDIGTTTYQQIVKTGDKLVEPLLPAAPNHSTFTGWFVYDEASGTYADTPIDFDAALTVTSEEEVVLRAVFDNYAYVIFHDQYHGGEGVWPVVATRRGELTGNPATASVEIGDLSVEYNGEQQDNKVIFRGWTRRNDVTTYAVVDPQGNLTDREGGAITLESDPIAVNQSVHLYPVFVNVNWISFSSAASGMGASYCPPQYYFADQGESDFPKPTMTGYVFDGWYTAEDGDADAVKIANADGSVALTGSHAPFYVVNGEVRVSEDAMLYGHWSPAPTTYSIVIMRQKATDAPGLADNAKTYDFAESFPITADTGSMTSVDTKYLNMTSAQQNPDTYQKYEGFTYRTCDSDEMVAGNGSTVIRVFYDRNVHTLTFRIPGNGNTYTTVKTVRGLYGSSVKDYFPIVGTNGTRYEGYIWEDNNHTTYSYVLATIETMPNADVTFNGSSRGTSKTIYYYVEVGSQAESDGTTFHSKYYKLYKTIKHGFNYLTYDEEFYPISGYVRDHANAEPEFSTSNNQATIPNNNINKLYYDREGFTIAFLDAYNNHSLGNVSVKFSESIEGYVPSDPTSSREGYDFNGWYMDATCSTRVFFNETDYNNSRLENKVLLEKMPAYNLQIFAGWEAKWYLAEIDPNGGVLREEDVQSTWFWETSASETIQEYTTVKRDFVEAIDGTWYYAVKDRAYYGFIGNAYYPEESGKSRITYYTQDINDPAADLSVKYKEAPGAYRYAGWYEVHPDGTETLYAFGEYMHHDTKLRLHWKQVGTYFIRYDARTGTMDGGDNNETQFHTLDSSHYPDNAQLVVTRTANAPAGYAFIGWQVRNGDGTVYRPGSSFIFRSVYGQTEVGTDGVERTYVIMDAVYTRIGTVGITYDANGGVVDSATVDYGTTTASGARYGVTETTATISGLENNAQVTLSNGDGFSNGTYILRGWNTAQDGSGDHFDLGSTVGVDTAEGNTLYAEWEVKVYFDRNNSQADWGGTWDSSLYTLDGERYYQKVLLNNLATEPSVVPVSNDPDKMFRYWGIKRYTDEVEEYDFSLPVTEELTLYACWTDLIEVPIHTVDASAETFVNKDSEWRLQPAIRMGNATTVDLSSSPVVYAAVDSSVYEYAFACVSDTMENISEERKITRVYYNNVARAVYVTYADTNEDVPMESADQIFLVYFENPKVISIGYKWMDTDRSLYDITLGRSGYPTEVSIGSYDLTAGIDRPLYWLNNSTYKYFAYAIGYADAANDEKLHLVTQASNNDNSRVNLLVRNSWRGLQYSTNNGSTWIDCGFDQKLFVVYFKDMPSVVTVNEKTIGTVSDMAESFKYKVTVTTKTTIVEQTQTQRRYWVFGWQDWPTTWTDSGDPRTQNLTDSEDPVEYELTDGQLETITLFYANTYAEGLESNPESSGLAQQTRTRVVTTTTIIQEITVEQTSAIGRGFDTDHSGVGSNRIDKYTYTYTTVSNGSDQNVTFTNTRIEDRVEVHVAVAQGGNLTVRDDLRIRNESDENDATPYTVIIPTGEPVALDGSMPEGLFTGGETYAFRGIYYGRADDEGTVTVAGTDVTSLHFAQLPGSEYYGTYLNNDPAKLLEGYSIYYVYSKLPVVRYMTEGANGALTEISPIERNGSEVSMNGAVVTQDTVLTVTDTEALIIDQAANGAYRMPPDLDGVDVLSLNYVKLAAGSADATNTGEMDTVADSKSLQLKVVDAEVKFSSDGTTWNSFSGEPVICAIYKERGYDLILTKTIAAEADEVPNDTFTVTIASSTLPENGHYVISGYEVNGTPVESVTVTDGKIVLTVKHGSDLEISSLPYGTYTVTETDAEGYTLTAQVDEYDRQVTDNALSVVLNKATKVDLTNTPEQFAYVIHHYLLGTETKVADDETGTKGFGSTLRAQASPAKYADYLRATVSSYDPSGSITVDEDESTNVITVFYTIPLTVTADDKGKAFGASDPELTVTLVGKVGEDVIDCSVTRETGEDVGTYTITPTVNTVPEYYVVTTENGTFTITPATVTVTATDIEILFGDSEPALTATVTGADPSAISYSISREAGADAGDYIISVTGDAVQGNGNYVVSFVNGTFTILCKVIFDKFDENAIFPDGFDVIQGVKRDALLATPANPTWNGSERSSFRGWLIEDDENGTYADNSGKRYSVFNFTSPITANVTTLIAQWTYRISFVVTGAGSNEMIFAFLIPFGEKIFNPGTSYAGTNPGYTCEGWFKDGDATESLVQFETQDDVSERVPKGGVTFRQKWVAEVDQTSAGRFLSLGSTYGVIDSISAGTTGPVTQSAKGRQLAARTAPQSTFTLKHAVYPAYTYYTVLRCDDLANPVWTAIEDSRQVTGVTATSVAIPVEGKRGFFRLLLSTKPLTKGATKLDQ